MRSDRPDARADARADKLRAPSGFPSPAEDVAEPSLDVHALLVRRPAATFFLRMRGDAMRGAGVYSGDILVVDRALRPAPRRLIVLAMAGELRVRRYIRSVASRGVFFIAAGDDVSELVSTDDALIWGVVTYVIHQADTLLPDDAESAQRFPVTQEAQ